MAVREFLSLLPQRMVLATMGFFAVAFAYTLRACLSVAIIEMVIPVNHTGARNGSIICPIDDEPTEDPTSPIKNIERFNWTQEQQGWILSSFYIGYIITHVPGGMLAERFGGKWTLSLGLLSTAIFTIATPITIEYGGHIALIILRICMGLGEGTTFPALNVLLSAWIPERERSKIGSFVFGGVMIGSILSFYLSGLILTFWSWRLVFYFWGSLAIVWFILFTILCTSYPKSHPFISQKELDYLEVEIGRLKRHGNLPPTPWKDIFTSVPVLALICAQIGHDWGFFIMVNDLPKYMKDVLGFPVYDVGLYSSLPYFVMWMVSLVAGILGDYWIVSGYFSITTVRKVFTGFAAIFPGIFILAASYSECNRIWVVLWFTLAMGTMGTFFPGMKVNPLDLSPNYAGSLMAIINGTGALTGIVAPFFAGMMTPNSLLEEWRLVFWVTFGVFVVTTIVYSIWASGKIQEWNSPEGWETKDTKTVQ